MLPARVESMANFRNRFKTAKVLIPNNPGMRPYGRNPYAGYDSASRPFLYRGGYPKGIKPMAYVIAVGKQAWPLDLISRKKSLTSDNLRLSWTAGQNSALDARLIKSGRDLGNVVVQEKNGSGWRDAVHDLTFAFVFHSLSRKGSFINNKTSVAAVIVRSLRRNYNFTHGLARFGPARSFMEIETHARRHRIFGLPP